ncbi:MAG: DUF3592 domain-containing protein [Acidimicrobiales bacterium]
MVGAWALGAVVVGVMRFGERAVAKRYERIVDGVDTVGIVTASRPSSVQRASLVFDLRYNHATGAEHALRGIALTGHVAIGSEVPVRYPPDRPGEGAVAPAAVRSTGGQVAVAAGVFFALGLMIGLAV